MEGGLFVLEVEAPSWVVGEVPGTSKRFRVYLSIGLDGFTTKHPHNFEAHLQTSRHHEFMRQARN